MVSIYGFDFIVPQNGKTRMFHVNQLGFQIFKKNGLQYESPGKSLLILGTHCHEPKNGSGSGIVPLPPIAVTVYWEPGRELLVIRWQQQRCARPSMHCKAPCVRTAASFV